MQKPAQAVRRKKAVAVFKGTPTQDDPGPNVEPYSEKSRPPFLAPAGVTNLASGRPVTSSDPEPISGRLEQITDGDKEGQRESVVELRRRTQWVQIDLGQPAELAAVVLWHAHHVHMVCHDVIVQVSNDPEFKDEVTTLFNNDFDNSSALGLGRDKEYFESHQGRLIDSKGAKARYIRVYGRGSTFVSLNWLTEIEVWGAPDTASVTLAPIPIEVPPDSSHKEYWEIPQVPGLEPPSRAPRAPFLAPPGTVNLALGRSVTSSDPKPTRGTLEMVTDGHKAVGWNQPDAAVWLDRRRQWIQIDLGRPATLCAIVVWRPYDVWLAAWDFVLQVSDDPEFKRGVTTLFNNDQDNSSGLGAGKDPIYVETNEGRLIDARGVKARYARLYSRCSTFTAFNTYVEVEAWGRAE